jgi:cytochrome c nitrite reductase small subunit
MSAGRKQEPGGNAIAGRRSAARAAKRLAVVAALVGATIGLATGVGGYVFVYAEGGSYLTNDPNACANCHVMKPHLDAWAKSSHHAVAVCNDCHAPKNLVGKYAVKGINGWNHSLAFTTGRFKEPFHITPMNHRVTENACRLCHADVVEAIDHPWSRAGEKDGSAIPGHAMAEERVSCVRCHSNVGHDVQ